MKKEMIGGSLFALCSTLAVAHPRHAVTNRTTDFLHQIMSFDHLLPVLLVSALLVGVGYMFVSGRRH